MIGIGHCVLGVKIARIDKVNGSFVVERCKVLATVVVVVLHDLLALLDHMLHPCFFLLLATVLLSLFGIRWIGAGCRGGNGVLIQLLYSRSVLGFVLSQLLEMSQLAVELSQLGFELSQLNVELSFELSFL